jgi:hypothetical protein
MSRIQTFRDLIFTSAIFISILAITASSTPVSTPSFKKLANAVFPRNDISDYGNTTDNALHLEPRTYKLSLPWWTQLVGAGIDFCTAFWTVTFAWEMRGSGKPRTGWYKVVQKFFGKSVVFVQTFSGFVHLAINSSKHSMILYPFCICVVFLEIGHAQDMHTQYTQVFAFVCFLMSKLD